MSEDWVNQKLPDALPSALVGNERRTGSLNHMELTIATVLGGLFFPS